MPSHQKSNKRTASASLTPQKQPPKRIYVKLKKTADVYVPVPSKTLFPQASNTLPESSSPDVSFSASQEGKHAVVNAMNIFAQVVFVYVLDQNVQEAGPSTPVVVRLLCRSSTGMFSHTVPTVFSTVFVHIFGGII